MKTIVTIVAVLVILGIIYFIFMDQINKFLGIGKIAGAPSWVSCKDTFYVKLPNGKTQNVFSSNVGTTSMPIMEFYKNDVTFTDAGIMNPGPSIKITQDEYKGLCKYQYNPPYAWYTNPPSASEGGHGRKMAMGGNVGYSSSCPSGTFINQATGQCIDWSKLPRTTKTKEDLIRNISDMVPSGVRTTSETIRPNDSTRYNVDCFKNAASGKRCCAAYGVTSGVAWTTGWICDSRQMQPTINPLSKTMQGINNGHNIGIINIGGSNVVGGNTEILHICPKGTTWNNQLGMCVGVPMGGTGRKKKRKTPPVPPS